MKNLFALLAALMLVSFYAYAQDNNCTATTTGTFCITVEEEIAVEGDYVCLDAICPGCSYELDEDQCMEFMVTGGEDCLANVTFNGEAPSNDVSYYATGSEVFLDGYWEYSEGGTGFNYQSIPTTVTSWAFDGDGDDDENQIFFRLCGTLNASCYAEAGEYSIVIACAANYVCGSF